MKKPTRFEAVYDSLNHIDLARIDDESKAELKQAINSSTSLLVSKASEIVGDAGLEELVPDMLATFDRFMINGAKNDKQCSAKTAIANALNKLNHMGDAVFLAGSHYTQMEPVWGGQVDTAVELRSACAYGLARIEHPDAHYVLTDHLVDTEKPVRIAAAKALTYLGSSESELLLRLKSLTGDSESEVIAECFTGLMTMTPDRSLDFVARYIQSDNASIAECAALAIGNSRQARGYDILRDCWDDDMSPTSRRRLLLPLALLRSTEAFDFLLKIVRGAEPKLAIEAISALTIYVDHESIAKLAQVVKSRGHKEVTAAFKHEFGRGVD